MLRGFYVGFLVVASSVLFGTIVAVALSGIFDYHHGATMVHWFKVDRNIMNFPVFSNCEDFDDTQATQPIDVQVP